MSGRDDGGGYAFPGQPLGHDGMPEREMHPGMELRDWFAGQALAGLLANTTRGAPSIVQEAYEMADAMIAARKQP